MATASETSESFSRRHDLDALRGFAMLLGIVLHSGISFIPGANVLWPVQDSQTLPSFGLLFAAIHGFRMPLFFLISGFFTAMLWRKRGLIALLWHRFQRIFIPMMLGTVTIIPLVWWVSGIARNNEPEPSTHSATVTDSQTDNDHRLIDAAAIGAVKRTKRLIEVGANLQQKDSYGTTPLHAAVFFGRSEIARILLDAGADIKAKNNQHQTPAEVLYSPFWIVNMVAGQFELSVNPSEWAQGQLEIARLMGVQLTQERTAELLKMQQSHSAQGATSPALGALIMLMNFPLWMHLWFLWFLCLLVVFYAILILVGGYFSIRLPARKLTLSRWGLMLMIVLTTIPQTVMSLSESSIFGPATSMGLLPNPTVLGYYAIFFLFGTLYFDAQDHSGQLGKNWWGLLLLGMILLPVGLGVSMTGGNSPALIIAYAFCQASYAWLISFGLIGLCRRWLSSPNQRFRYLSDSSYWLYLVHLPLVLSLQYVVSGWTMQPLLKLFIICTMTTIALLLSYQLFVRYTPIGTLLNGPRTRPSKRDAAVAIS